MTSYRYLGSATTDANGIAKYNFTGSGAGEIDFIASLDNPIVDGSIVSVPCSVWDTLFFDNCTDDTKKSTWLRYNNTVSEPVFDDTGMFVERTETGNGYLVINSVIMDTRPFPLDFAIEFEVVARTGEVRYQNTNGDWQDIRNMNANDTYKVEYYSDHQVITKNNGTPTSYEKTNTGNQGVRFQFVGVGSIKLKNVKVYSI